MAIIYKAFTIVRNKNISAFTDVSTENHRIAKLPALTQREMFPPFCSGKRTARDHLEHLLQVERLVVAAWHKGAYNTLTYDTGLEELSRAAFDSLYARAGKFAVGYCCVRDVKSCSQRRRK